MRIRSERSPVPTCSSSSFAGSRRAKLAVAGLVSALAAVRLETAQQAAHASHPPHGDASHRPQETDLRVYQYKSPQAFRQAGNNLLALHLFGSIATTAFTYKLFQRFGIMNTVPGRIGWGLLNFWFAYATFSMTDNVVTEVRLTPNRENVVVRTGFISPVSYHVKVGDFRLDSRNNQYSTYVLKGVESGDLEVILPFCEATEKDYIPQQDLFRSIITGDSFRIKQLTHA